MTPDTSTALKVIVERAVRPVRATFERKRRMREELLAHVGDVFGEELAKSGNEAAAIAATRERFGDAGLVAQELQRSVPSYDRWYSAIERGVTGQPGEMAAKRAFRWAVFVMAHIVATLAFFVLPIKLACGKVDDLVPLVAVCAILAIGAAILTFQIVLLGMLLGKRLFVPEQRSVLRSGMLVLGSLILSAGTILLLNLALAQDLGWSLWMLKRELVFSAPLFLAMLFIVAWKFDSERHEIDAWATLSVD